MPPLSPKWQWPENKSLVYAIEVKKIDCVHAYEELRGVVIDILVGRENIRYGAQQYMNLVNGVAEVLIRRGATHTDNPIMSGDIRMDDRDVELVRDVFWDLFRQGIITLGLNDSNDHWPFFRLSHHGKETLLNKNSYRFHDATSYLGLIKGEAPDISGIALNYLEEAIATFYSDCLLSTCIMIGVAAEIEFLRLLDVGMANQNYSSLFKPVNSERTLRQKIVRFQRVPSSLPEPIRTSSGEDIETHVNTIQSILRVSRNDAGHALADKTPNREQVYVYLQLFAPSVGHITRLRQALT
jgi:hypothetical protein